MRQSAGPIFKRVSGTTLGGKFNGVSPRKSILSSSHSDPIANAALGYVARRARTVAQMNAYLMRIGASATKTRSLIAKFQKLGYLNDRLYAQRWARDRIARKPMGRERLMHELQAQGLEERLVAETLAAIFAEHSEYNLVRALSHKKIVSAQFLRSRGFSEEVIESFTGDATEPFVERQTRSKNQAIGRSRRFQM